MLVSKINCVSSTINWMLVEFIAVMVEEVEVNSGVCVASVHVYTERDGEWKQEGWVKPK